MNFPTQGLALMKIRSPGDSAVAVCIMLGVMPFDILKRRMA